jgi:hypothetical protein
LRLQHSGSMLLLQPGKLRRLLRGLHSDGLRRSHLRPRHNCSSILLLLLLLLLRLCCRHGSSSGGGRGGSSSRCMPLRRSDGSAAPQGWPHVRAIHRPRGPLDEHVAHVAHCAVQLERDLKRARVVRDVLLRERVPELRLLLSPPPASLHALAVNGCSPHCKLLPPAVVRCARVWLDFAQEACCGAA